MGCGLCNGCFCCGSNIGDVAASSGETTALDDVSDSSVVVSEVLSTPSSLPSSSVETLVESSDSECEEAEVSISSFSFRGEGLASIAVDSMLSSDVGVELDRRCGAR